ncbi:MAG: SufE family protein [Paracoccaceae bacterium]|nr:SufE family protein [Paracoccaceae bacterium]
MASAEFEELVETFEFLDEWEDRYGHVIDMGRAMPPLADDQKLATTKVEGCASQVWLVPEVNGQGATAVFGFGGDSDAMIVKGLIAILHSLYNGLTMVEVSAVDAPAEMARLGLNDHLSSQRSNGLRAMIERIRAIAAAAQA